MGRHDEELGQLTGWFRNRLENVEPFQMTEEDYSEGIDRLPENLNALTKEAFDYWLTQRKYELSYNQMCNAFFAAAQATGKLTLIPRHPIFRLNTKVLIKEVTTRDRGERVTNVPGTITSISGDEHIITIAVAIGDDCAGRLCVIVHTNDLEKELSLQ